MKVTRLMASRPVLAVLFLLVTHTTAAAQQPASAVQRAHGAAGVTVPARALPGPRLQPEWRSVQPAFADSSASPAPVSGSNTITISTVALVLVVIIVVLLIVK